MLAAKRTMLHRCQNDIKTLVLGSSHGEFGFDPAYCPDSFNMCCQSQDLKHSYFLYEKLLKSTPLLTNVVIFYSVFSGGNVMERSSTEKEICPAINELFNLNLEYQDGTLKILSDNIKGRLDRVALDLGGFNGFMPKSEDSFMRESYGAVARANDHLKLAARDDANLYLIRIILLAKHVGHKVYVVIPPGRSDYKNAIDAQGVKPFAGLYDIIHNYKFDYKVNVLDCFGAGDFDDSYFGDFDHLIPSGEGVKLLSTRLHDLIEAGG